MTDLEQLIRPFHVWLTLLTFGGSAITILWKLFRIVARMEMKLDILWSRYEKEKNIEVNGKA